MTKCKLCKGDKDNAMHLFGHHPFTPDMDEVELPDESVLGEAMWNIMQRGRAVIQDKYTVAEVDYNQPASEDDNAAQ